MSSPLTELKDLICQNINDNVHSIDHKQFFVDFDEILKQNAKPDNKCVTDNLVKKLFEEINHFMHQKLFEPYYSQASYDRGLSQLKDEKRAEKQKLIGDTRTIPIRESDFNDLSRADYHNNQNHSEYGYFYLSVKDASDISGISYCINAILSVDYHKHKDELDSIILEVTNYCKKNIKDEHNIIGGIATPPHLLHCLSLVDRENYRKLALKKQLIEINYQQLFLDAIEESNRITASLKESFEKMQEKGYLKLEQLMHDQCVRIKRSIKIDNILTHRIKLSDYDNGTSMLVPSREKIIRLKKDIMQLIAEKKDWNYKCKECIDLIELYWHVNTGPIKEGDFIFRTLGEETKSLVNEMSNKIYRPSCFDTGSRSTESKNTDNLPVDSDKEDKESLPDIQNLSI